MKNPSFVQAKVYIGKTSILLAINQQLNSFKTEIRFIFFVLKKKKE